MIMEGKMECNLFGKIFFLPQEIDMGEILKFSSSLSGSF